MIKLEPGETRDGITNNGYRPLYIGHHGEMNNVTEEFKPNPCYWCGEAAVIKRGSGTDWYWINCCSLLCHAVGPHRHSESEAVAAWNSLAARLKPEPKKVTIKRFVNVCDVQGDILTSDTYASRDDALCAADQFLKDVRKSDLLETVEVEITFTDRRGVSE